MTIIYTQIENKQQQKSTGAAAGNFSVGDDDTVLLKAFVFVLLILM